MVHDESPFFIDIVKEAPNLSAGASLSIFLN
jgi:hypothetical protein